MSCAFLISGHSELPYCEPHKVTTYQVFTTLEIEWVVAINRFAKRFVITYLHLNLYDIRYWIVIVNRQCIIHDLIWLFFMYNNLFTCIDCSHCTQMSMSECLIHFIELFILDLFINQSFNLVSSLWFDC